MNYKSSKMFSQGGTLGTDFSFDTDDNKLRIFPMDINEFSVGDQVSIWDNSGISEMTTITNIEQNIFYTNVTVTGLSNDYPEFSGIRKVDSKIDFEVKSEMVTNAYGDVTDGIDGGVFVEWAELLESNAMIPKMNLSGYTGSDQAASQFFNNFIEYWTNDNDLNNVIKLIEAYIGNGNGNVGFHGASRNIANVFYGQILEIFSSETQDMLINIATSVTIHEFAHHFNVVNEHVDNNNFLSSTDHTGNGECVMSYLHNSKVEHVEFDFNVDGCINDIRNAINPR